MPSPSSVLPVLRRRTALLGALAVGTAACTPYTVEQDRPTTLPGRPDEVDPDIALAATVLADEREVLSRVEATGEAHPRLRRLLADARAGHEAHIALLEDAVPEPTAGPSPSASTSPPAAPPESRVRVPEDARRALAAVARREEELSLTGRRSAFSAESGAFARVLAGMAAAAAQQAAVLGTARVPEGRR